MTNDALRSRENGLEIQDPTSWADKIRQVGADMFRLVEVEYESFGGITTIIRDVTTNTRHFRDTLAIFLLTFGQESDREKTEDSKCATISSQVPRAQPRPDSSKSSTVFWWYNDDYTGRSIRYDEHPSLPRHTRDISSRFRTTITREIGGSTRSDSETMWIHLGAFQLLRRFKLIAILEVSIDTIDAPVSKFRWRARANRSYLKCKNQMKRQKTSKGLFCSLRLTIS